MMYYVLDLKYRSSLKLEKSKYEMTTQKSLRTS